MVEVFFLSNCLVHSSAYGLLKKVNFPPNSWHLCSVSWKHVRDWGWCQVWSLRWRTTCVRKKLCEFLQFLLVDSPAYPPSSAPYCYSQSVLASFMPDHTNGGHLGRGDLNWGNAPRQIGLWVSLWCISLSDGCCGRTRITADIAAPLLWPWLPEDSRPSKPWGVSQEAAPLHGACFNFSSRFLFYILLLLFMMICDRDMSADINPVFPYLLLVIVP